MEIVKIVLIFLHLFLTNKLASGCMCDDYEDISSDPTVFESTVLPEDDCCKASVGNGYLATTVYTSTVYMNGLYNGRGGASDRARIPSTTAIMVDHNQAVGELESYRLDVFNGTFFHSMETSQAYIEQRLYAHQVLTRLLVNEITIKRKLGDEEPVFLNLTSNQGEESEDINFDVIPPTYEGGPWSSSGMTMVSETETSSLCPVFTYWTAIPDNLTLPSHQTDQSWTFITAISDSQAAAHEMYDTGVELATEPGALYAGHRDAWTKKWEKGRIHVDGNLKLSKAIYGSMYYILASLPPLDAPTTHPFQFYGLSPGGLATGGYDKDYRGHIFWDQETWMYPPMLMLYPELALAMLQSRTMHLEAVKEYARQMGDQGARFPWETAYTGFDVCPAPDPAEYEIHLNGDISFAMQQYLYATNDTEFLTTGKGFELIKELANYWAGRVTYDTQKKAYTILGVMPPDEDHAPVNNSVYTNTVAQVSLRLPYYAASLIDQPVPDTWAQIADQMYIPYDEDLDYHPEFEGYERGTIVKQADTILLGYPLMTPMEESTRVNDLTYYEEYTEHTGPAMTWGMFAVGWLELGDLERADDLFSQSYLNIREPYKIWTETAQGIGAVNFITGMGGFLQAVLMGYGGLRLQEDELYMKVTLPEDTLKVTFIGLDYLGSSFDVRTTSTMTVLELTEARQDAVSLEIVADQAVFPFSLGEPVVFTGSPPVIIRPYTGLSGVPPTSACLPHPCHLLVLYILIWCSIKV